jgi:hypothetical protein
VRREEGGEIIGGKDRDQPRPQLTAYLHRFLESSHAKRAGMEHHEKFIEAPDKFLHGANRGCRKNIVCDEVGQLRVDGVPGIDDPLAAKYRH